MALLSPYATKATRTRGAGTGTTALSPSTSLSVAARLTTSFTRLLGVMLTMAPGTHASVLLANNNCPTPIGTVSHQLLPDFDADDVVSHEWGHAYTEHTHA